MENLFYFHEPQEIRINMGINLITNEIKVLPVLRVWILDLVCVISCNKILWIRYFTMKTKRRCITM